MQPKIAPGNGLWNALWSALWNVLWNALWNAPGRGVFRLGYVTISSEANSFANRLRLSSYVDPPSFSFQLTPDTTFLRAFQKSVPPATHLPDT